MIPVSEAVVNATDFYTDDVVLFTAKTCVHCW